MSQRWDFFVFVLFYFFIYIHIYFIFCGGGGVYKKNKSIGRGCREMGCNRVFFRPPVLLVVTKETVGQTNQPSMMTVSPPYLTIRSG